MNKFNAGATVLVSILAILPAEAQTICEASGVLSEEEIEQFCPPLTRANMLGEIPILADVDCPPAGPDSSGDCTPDSIVIPGGLSWGLVSLGNQSLSISAFPEGSILPGIADQLLSGATVTRNGATVIDGGTLLEKAEWDDLQQILRREVPWVDGSLGSGRTIFLLHRE